MVLLSDSQRFFFDLIPKPEINNDKKKNSLSAKHIVKGKLHKINKGDIMENYEQFNKRNNEVDKKIYYLLDNNLKKELSSVPLNSGSIIYFNINFFILFYFDRYDFFK